MPKLSIKIKDKSGRIIAENTNDDLSILVYRQAYSEGDIIILTSSEKNQYLVIQLDDAISQAFVYLTENELSFAIPFNEKKASYSHKCFSGEVHLLTARIAHDFEVHSYKNLAKNEYDQHENSVCFPHASANVETRGESVFAARNAIDGNTENHSHGEWPYESWGINCRDDAEITVSFGRPVEIDLMIIYTRADFPHDNWWEKVTYTFSDGSVLVSNLTKTAAPQRIDFPKKTVEWVRMSNLIRADDPSPFPALSQWEIYGTDSIN